MDTKLASPNFKGFAKVNRLINYLGDLENYELEAYFDIRGDKEFLEVAKMPHYRNFISKAYRYTFL